MWQPFTADFLKRYFSEIAKKQKKRRKRKRKRKNKNRKENTKRHKIAKLTNSGSPQSRNTKKTKKKGLPLNRSNSPQTVSLPFAVCVSIKGFPFN